MINRKGLAIVVFLIPVMGLFLNCSSALSYTQPTHNVLTEKIINLYNQIYDPDITQEQKQELIQGSFNEDVDPRWINHFYDPMTGEGWLGKRLGNLPDDQVRRVSKIIFGKDAVSAMDWVHDQQLQENSYYRYEGNRTLESAILYYLNNNEKEAFKSLGYVLHAVEDMAVPAHTRQDSHFDMEVPKAIEDLTGIKFDKGEPYEDWANNNSKVKSMNLAENYQPICYSLNDCMNILAQYSNSNFFSSDTILDSEYVFPQIDHYKDLYLRNNQFRLYFGKDNNVLSQASFLQDQNIFSEASTVHPEVNSAYWNNLAPKTILAGVEVLKYFQDQLVRAKNQEIAIEKVEKPELITLLTGISLYGEYSKVYGKGKEFATDFYSRLKELARTGKRSFDKVITFLQQPNIFNAFLTYLPPGPTIEETIFAEKIELPDLSIPEDEEVPSGGRTPTEEELIGMGGPIMNLLGYDYDQEELDEIAEKIDIIRQKVKEIMADFEANTNFDDEQGDNSEQDQTSEDTQEDQVTQANSTQTSGNSSNTPEEPKPIYSKILISEIQISGATDEKEEFVELYNPNDIEVSLTDWYMQRKTKTGSDYSTFVSSTLFSGKKIFPKSYFVIGRQGSSFEATSDIVNENPITEDNALVLKNPNREVSDKVGFGSAQDYEMAPFLNPVKGQTIGRKWISNTEQDTDNNAYDFEAQKQTLRAKNIIWVNPGLPNLPGPPGPPVNLRDLIAPKATFNLAATQTDINFTISFELEDVFVSATPSNLKGFILRWKEDQGPWQTDVYQNIPGAPNKYTGTKTLTGKDSSAYYFQVKTNDIAGNESDWQPEIPAETKVLVPRIVLINEIQVAGLINVDDEFVELYNPTSIDIDLTDWYIQKKAKTGTSFSTFIPSSLFTGKKIKSKSYFLISNSAASTASISDIVTTYSLAKDNSLVIKNASGDVVDKIGFGDANDFETQAIANPLDGQSIQRKWDDVKLIHQDTDNNSIDFELGVSSPKPSMPKAAISDITNYAICDLSTTPGARYYNLTLKWTSPNTNVDHYDVQYKMNNGPWTDWVMDTKLVQSDYRAYNSLFTDYIYYFRVRSVDTEGNTGEYQEITVDLQNPVVINEVGLYGTNASTTDKWIELYNKSNNAVDLTNWKLYYGTTAYLTLQGIIPAKGFYIFEHTDDNTILNVTANAVFLSSINSANLYLVTPKNRQVDKFYNPTGGWPSSEFIKNGNTYSMERISPFEFGTNSKNWRTNNGNIINGSDRNSNTIYGTPGAQNSNYQIYTPLSKDFIEDTTLPLSLSPYVITNSQLVVFKNKTLTIEPGVIIKFEGVSSGLYIEGTLKAKGNSNQKIVFTEYEDDEYGGDTNQDGSATHPSTEGWTGLIFSKYSTGSEMDNTVLRYAGYNYGDQGSAGIKVRQTSISLSNSTVEKNLENGITLDNSNSVISSSTFKDQSVPNYYTNRRGINIKGGSPSITNSYFSNNKDGIYIISFWDENNVEFEATPTITDNIFENNEDAMFITNKVNPILSNNQAINNQINGTVLGSDIHNNMTLKKDLPYIIKSSLSVSTGASLTIEPGAVIKFYNSNSGLSIGSKITAIGTSTESIIFTSMLDDEYGGDTNQDGSATSPHPGDWMGIYITENSSSLSELNHVLVRYGGDFLSSFTSAYGAGIRVDKVAISIKNSIVERGVNGGVWLNNSQSTIENSSFREFLGKKAKSTSSAIGGSGILVNGGSPSITNSSITDNYHGLYIDKWFDVINNIEILANITLSNNTFLGNIIADIFDTSNPPPTS